MGAWWAKRNPRHTQILFVTLNSTTPPNCIWAVWVGWFKHGLAIPSKLDENCRSNPIATVLEGGRVVGEVEVFPSVYLWNRFSQSFSPLALSIQKLSNCEKGKKGGTDIHPTSATEL